MANIFLGLWNPKTPPKRIKLTNIDLENKVGTFKNHTLQVVTDIPRAIELSFCGLILEDENKLSSYGIRDGVTIHVLEKFEEMPELKVENKMNPTEMINGFRALVSFPNYRNILQRLTRSEVVDRVLTACPELYDDPSMIGFIQDPELIYYLSKPEYASDLIENHPALLAVGHVLLAEVREEQANMNPNAAGTSTGYSYSLEALSDDDEEMDPSDPAFHQNPLTRNTSFNAITAAQLAAAIANATNTQFNTNSAGVPSSQSSSNIITNEMFSNAIQQAITFGTQRDNRMDDSDDNRLRIDDAEGWREQLKQMHEMGLRDDAVNLRALRAVNGDVNAAIELVLSLNELQ